MNSDFISSLLPLVVLFAIFYFLIIRPQQKQTKEHEAMIGDLEKGDVVITNGGIIVEITKVEGNFLSAKTIDGSAVRVVKTHISSKWEEK